MFHCVARKRPFPPRLSHRFGLKPAKSLFPVESWPRLPFRPATTRIQSLHIIVYRKLSVFLWRKGSNVLKLLTTAVQTGLAAGAIVATVSLVVSAQTPAPNIDHVPAAPNPGVADASPPTTPSIPGLVDIEMQHRFNVFRSKILDDRAVTIGWWLTSTAIFLTLFALLAAFVGFLGFRRFREIEVEAKQGARSARKQAKDAEHYVQEIEKHRNKAKGLLDINAEEASNNPARAAQAIQSVNEDSRASLLDKAIAHAFSLQRDGRTSDAIEKWRAVASIAEEGDSNLAVTAWFSVGYLTQDDSPNDSIFAYDQVVRLKPDHAMAYNNRGVSKHRQGQHNAALADYNQAIHLQPDFPPTYNNRGKLKETLNQYAAAIADFDQAILLKSDFAAAYFNRGMLKAILNQKGGARVDLEFGLRIAQDTNNISAELVSEAEQCLRSLDDAVP